MLVRVVRVSAVTVGGIDGVHTKRLWVINSGAIYRLECRDWLL